MIAVVREFGVRWSIGVMERWSDGEMRMSLRQKRGNGLATIPPLYLSV